MRHRGAWNIRAGVIPSAGVGERQQVVSREDVIRRPIRHAVTRRVARNAGSKRLIDLHHGKLDIAKFVVGENRRTRKEQNTWHRRNVSVYLDGEK